MLEGELDCLSGSCTAILDLSSDNGVVTGYSRVWLKMKDSVNGGHFNPYMDFNIVNP